MPGSIRPRSTRRYPIVQAPDERVRETIRHGNDAFRHPARVRDISPRHRTACGFGLAVLHERQPLNPPELVRMQIGSITAESLHEPYTFLGTVLVFGCQMRELDNVKEREAELGDALVAEIDKFFARLTQRSVRCELFRIRHVRDVLAVKID